MARTLNEMPNSQTMGYSRNFQDNWKKAKRHMLLRSLIRRRIKRELKNPSPTRQIKLPVTWSMLDPGRDHDTIQWLESHGYKVATDLYPGLKKMHHRVIVRY